MQYWNFKPERHVQAWIFLSYLYSYLKRSGVMDSYLCFILVQWNYRWCEKILKHGSLTIDKLFVTETKENISGEKQKNTKQHFTWRTPRMLWGVISHCGEIKRKKLKTSSLPSHYYMLIASCHCFLITTRTNQRKWVLLNVIHTSHLTPLQTRVPTV